MSSFFHKNPGFHQKSRISENPRSRRLLRTLEVPSNPVSDGQNWAPKSLDSIREKQRFRIHIWIWLGSHEVSKCLLRWTSKWSRFGPFSRLVSPKKGAPVGNPPSEQMLTSDPSSLRILRNLRDLGFSEILDFCEILNFCEKNSSFAIHIQQI